MNPAARGTPGRQLTTRGLSEILSGMSQPGGYRSRLRPAAFAIGAFAAACALFAGCGDPSAVPRKFEFEPAPVVTLENGTPVILNTEEGGCGSFLPDRVTALVSNESLQAVEEWIGEVGFEVLDKSPGTNYAILFLRVPFGASPDAAEALAEVEGVIAAGVGGTPEGPVPCRTLQ